MILVCGAQASGLLTTLSVKLASVNAPSLSVARIVTVKLPSGPALLIETTPVVLSTVIVPVNPAGVTLCTTIELTEPSSPGPVVGLTVNEPPTTTDAGLGYDSVGGVFCVKYLPK